MEEKYNLVVRLAHLGYKYSGNSVSVQVLAQGSEHMDVNFGGHSHAFLDEQWEIWNKKGHLVIVNQTGWGGMRIGSLDIWWSRRRKLANPHNTMLKVS